MPYFRVKILELLLYLDALELGSGTEKPYFYRSQVETVKAIRSYLAEHLDQHITLEALSRQYQIPLTTMKACFKSVYGSPVNTYMRALRMDRAALLLRKEPEASVTEIAGAVGYDSSSKFAAAFRRQRDKLRWNTGEAAGTLFFLFLTKRSDAGRAERQTRTRTVKIGHGERHLTMPIF